MVSFIQMNPHQILDLDAYDFTLPDGLIAKSPISPRDHSRLLVIDRKSGHITEKKFFEIKDFFSKGDCLVTNNTKVIPARLIGVKETGAKAECLLLKALSPFSWEALVKPGKKITEGTRLIFSEGFEALVTAVLPSGNRVLEFRCDSMSITEAIKKYGKIPLPSYINEGEAKEEDRITYQTIYAKEEGSAAAPTAGLHFTQNLLDDINRQGADLLSVTLHVGVGTFRPVKEKDIRNHLMHSESYTISTETASKINESKGNLFAVGTTSLRAIESNASLNGKLNGGSFDTSIFIYPGFQFKRVNHLITNFHLPKSSLLMLVSAFAGYELIREAYQKAIKDRFRFYSYGDAMLII